MFAGTRLPRGRPRKDCTFDAVTRTWQSSNGFQGVAVQKLVKKPHRPKFKVRVCQPRLGSTLFDSFQTYYVEEDDEASVPDQPEEPPPTWELNYAKKLQESAPSTLHVYCLDGNDKFHDLQKTEDTCETQKRQIAAYHEKEPPVFTPSLDMRLEKQRRVIQMLNTEIRRSIEESKKKDKAIKYFYIEPLMKRLKQEEAHYSQVQEMIEGYRYEVCK